METQEQSQGTQEPAQKLTVPVAIVVAGIIIALAVIYTGGKGGSNAEVPDQDDIAKQAGEAKQKLADNVKPVDPNEHILGNPNAQVKIVEFSDIECPFCKRFQTTMQQVMDEYGKDGRVAWVYRHFPLQIHPKATPEAEATECVWEQGGNAMFWKYLDALFVASLSNNQTDLAILASEADKIEGINMTKFNSCITNRTYKKKVEEDVQDGLNSGVSGTPYSIVIAANGKKFPINGALPIENVRTIIELALKEK
ncbi:MAG: thioredoxin domain-containing protein [Patescibacteria group bacterium]